MAPGSCLLEFQRQKLRPKIGLGLSPTSLGSVERCESLEATMSEKATHPGAGGFAVLDDKGRLPLPQELRDALGLHAGSAVACILLNGMILLLPQDREMVELMEHTVRALKEAGITAQDFLDNLPKAREEVMIEAYGEEFVRDLERRYAALVGTEIEAPDEK